MKNILLTYITSHSFLSIMQVAELKKKLFKENEKLVVQNVYLYFRLYYNYI